MAQQKSLQALKQLPKQRHRLRDEDEDEENDAWFRFWLSCCCCCCGGGGGCCCSSPSFSSPCWFADDVYDSGVSELELYGGASRSEVYGWGGPRSEVLVVISPRRSSMIQHNTHEDHRTNKHYHNKWYKPTPKLRRLHIPEPIWIILNQAFPTGLGLILLLLLLLLLF